MATEHAATIHEEDAVLEDSFGSDQDLSVREMAVADVDDMQVAVEMLQAAKVTPLSARS